MNRQFLLGVWLGGLCWLAWPCLAQTTVVHWDNLTATADAAFQRGPARAMQVRQRGQHRSSALAAGRWQSLSASHWAELGWPDGVDMGEHVTSINLNVALGEGPALRQADWMARAEAEAAALRLARLGYVQHAHRLYLTWWQAQVLARHLEDFRADFAAVLAPLDEAFERRAISRLDLTDARLELARLAFEVAELEHQATLAQGHLQTLLGQPITLSTQGMPILEQPRVPNDNPWLAVRQRLAQHPQLRALKMQEAAARARGRAVSQGAPWVLSPGLGIRVDEARTAWVALNVGVTLPIADTTAASVNAATADAVALRAEQQWQVRQLGAALEAEVARLESIRRFRARLETNWLRPLEARQRVLDDALRKGQTDRWRVIRGQREMHEAHHQHLVVTAQWLVHDARGRALLALLDLLDVSEEVTP